MSNEETKACPACAEEIKAIAKKCKHCGEILDDSLKQASTEVRKSDLAPETRAKIQKDLDGLSIHTGKLVGLTIATGGWLYLLLHMKTIQTQFNKLFNKQFGEKLFAGMIFTYGAFLLCFINLSNFLTAELASHHPSRSALRDLVGGMNLTGLLVIATVVLLITLSFKLKKGVEEYAKSHNIDFKMNSVHTFVFNFFYINYSLNKLKNM